MASNSKVNIRVKVISDIEERIGDESHGNVKSGSCDVIDNITFSVKVLYMHEKHINLMKKGRFYLLRGVLVSNYIKVGDQTVVMSCGPFSFDQNIELNYVSPPIVSVVEALASPKKRRISVCGTVAEVSGVLTSEKSTRKVLKLSDGPNNFVVKLWGGKSSLNVPPVGSDVTVTGVNISDFQGKAQGNSSLTTCVVESSHEETFEGVLDAMSFDRDDCLMTLVGSEVMLSVSTIMMQQVFKDLDFKPNVAVKGEKKGSRVVEIGPTEEPTKILRTYRDTYLSGRPLKIGTNISVSGDTSLIFIDSIWEDSISEIGALANLRFPLEIQFYGEEAEDYGGPRKEFFRLFMEELKFRMIKLDEEKCILHKNSQFIANHAYYVTGIVIGLSALENGPCPDFLDNLLINWKKSEEEYDMLKAGLERTGLWQVNECTSHEIVTYISHHLKKNNNSKGYFQPNA